MENFQQESGNMLKSIKNGGWQMASKKAYLSDGNL